MIRIVGRRIQGKSRWSVGRMVFRPVRLKTGTGQQFGSSGSYAVLAGIRGSRSRVQRRNLLWSSFVRRSFLKYQFACSLILAAILLSFPVPSPIFVRTGHHVGEEKRRQWPGITHLSRGRTSNQRRWRSILGTGARLFFLRCRPCLFSQVSQSGGKTPAVLLTTRTGSWGMTLR